MALPYLKELRIGAYLLKQKLAGRKRYPLVLMLEPLFRCNLACFGCGKIDYPDAILNRRLSVKECLDAVDECGAPMVAIPGGEPLIHKEIGEIVKGIVARNKLVSPSPNVLLLEKKLPLFEPSPYLFFSVHLDGLKEHHDKSVCQEGVFDRAVSAIKAAQAKGFTVNVNATIYDGHPPKDIAAFLDFARDLGVGVSISPGYAYHAQPHRGGGEPGPPPRPPPNKGLCPAPFRPGARRARGPPPFLFFPPFPGREPSPPPPAGGPSHRERFRGGKPFFFGGGRLK